MNVLAGVHHHMSAKFVSVCYEEKNEEKCISLISNTS